MPGLILYQIELYRLYFEEFKKLYEKAAAMNAQYYLTVEQFIKFMHLSNNPLYELPAAWQFRLLPDKAITLIMLTAQVGRDPSNIIMDYYGSYARLS